MIAVAALCWAAAASGSGGHLPLVETSVGGEYTAYVTRGVRLGYNSGRPFTFYLNFSFEAESSLHEANGQYSSMWSTVVASNGTEVRDVVVSKTLALEATFKTSPAATVSFLSFGDLAADHGAFICNQKAGVGLPPAECTRGAQAIRLTDCAASQCWVPVDVPDEPRSMASVQAGVVLAPCVVHGSIEGKAVCLSPAGTVVRNNVTYAAYTIGLGSANPDLVWWYNGKGTGELYFPRVFMDHVEAAALVALTTVTFVLWCEQTAVVTQYVKAAASKSTVVAAIEAFSVSGSNYILLLAADIAATLAYGLTSMCYRMGGAMVAPEASALLPTAYASMLAVSSCAIAWLATVLIGILALYKPPTEKGDTVVYAAKALAVRCTFEVTALIGIHTFLPRQILFEFNSVVGLLFGLVAMVVVSRDLCFVLWLKVRWAAALVALVWVATFQYASFALILPAVAKSSAVSSSQNTALLYSAALSLQAAAAGVMDALRKFEWI